MKTRLETINIVVLFGSIVENVYSFKNTKQGLEDAQTFLKELIEADLKYKLTDSEWEEILSNNYFNCYECGKNEYKLMESD